MPHGPDPTGGPSEAPQDRNPPPPGYPTYPPPGYPTPGAGGYPPPGYPTYYPPGATPRQHAWRTSGPARGPQRPNSPRSSFSRNQRSLVWLIIAVAVAVILLRTHRLSSTDVILFCVLIPSVMLHEISHGAVAYLFGDDTARRAGRLSLNPIRHVTLFGTIIVPIITVIAHFGYFGWAKPVPVNVRNLRSPRNQGVLVALAGPLTNVLIAAVFGVIFYVTFAAGRVGPVPTSLGARIVFYAGVINLWVACFNMIPIPPLDGSAVIERLLPASWWPGYLRLRPYGMIAILLAIVVMSYSNVNPLGAAFFHITTWWAHVVHAT